MHFLDYPLLFITAADSTLAKIGERAGAHILDHPDIGGRFTAFTNVGMVPAAICGVDTAKLWQGAKKMYSQYRPHDKLCHARGAGAWHLEQQGIVDVFVPVYSHALFAASSLIVQLCHETFGKAGLGQRISRTRRQRASTTPTSASSAAAATSLASSCT